MNRYDLELLFTKAKFFFFQVFLVSLKGDDLVKRSQASGTSPGRFPSCRDWHLATPLFCDVTCHGIWGLKWWFEKTCPHSYFFFLLLGDSGFYVEEKGSELSSGAVCRCMQWIQKIIHIYSKNCCNKGSSKLLETKVLRAMMMNVKYEHEYCWWTNSCTTWDG